MFISRKGSAQLQKRRKLCEVVGDKPVIRKLSYPRQPPVNVGNGAVYKLKSQSFNKF